MLIGRTAELDVIAGHLDRHGQVTILGPGGVGKTALARALLAEREHLFVELAAVANDGRVAERVATRLGFHTSSQLVEWLADNPRAVVLDTCEHVLDGAADLAQAIADGAPGSAVVATSRVPLDLPEEFVFLLQPLALPALGAVASPATELFIQRARTAGAPDVGAFAPEAIARLCARLDGVPLAIELAAARCLSMTPDEIVEHLAHDVDVLRRRRHRGEERHRSLRATIDWSYRLLDAEEQRVLRALSVFPHTITRNLAHAVCAHEDTSELDTAELLAGLVDHSLLSAAAGPRSTRFRLLDTTRAYAREQAARAGESEALRDRYIDAVCKVASTFLSSNESGWTSAVLNHLIDLIDDLLAAARMALDDEKPDRSYLLMMVMWGVVHHARCAEIADLGERVLARWPDEGYPLWADAASTTALALRESGRHEASERLARRALGQMQGGMFAAVSLHRTLALHERMRDPAAALKHIEHAVEAAERMGLVPFVRELRVYKAEFLGSLDRVEEGLAVTEEVIEQTEPMDVNHNWGLLVRGMLQLMVDPVVAEQTLKLAHRSSTAANYPFGMGASLRLLAIHSLDRSDYGRAAEYLIAAIEHNERTANHGELGVALLTAVVLLRAAVHPGAERVAAGSQGSSARPLLGVRALDERLVPKSAPGHTLPTAAAVRAALSALAEVVAGRIPEAPPPVVLAGEPPASGAPAALEPRLQRAGDSWIASYGGRTTSLRHTKGLDDIARLLAVPGEEIHVVDLAGARVIETPADDTIDAVAMRQYRARVRELQSELDEANAHADIGRAERIREELDALVEQLSSATGIGGRVRRTNGTAERARIAVTKRIRGKIKKLLRTHPELGRHLDAAISTGLYCKYEPERPVEWRL